VLLHDGTDNREKVNRVKTVSALPELIKELQAKGYDLVTVPELLKLQPTTALQPLDGPTQLSKQITAGSHQ
jgi:peptidoglycan/xylan/chitin deacetylase (PgdA/CDA1 family)